jgi:hypothetical protein
VVVLFAIGMRIVQVVEVKLVHDSIQILSRAFCITPCIDETAWNAFRANLSRIQDVLPSRIATVA